RSSRTSARSLMRGDVERLPKLSPVAAYLAARVRRRYPTEAPKCHARGLDVSPGSRWRCKWPRSGDMRLVRGLDRGRRGRMGLRPVGIDPRGRCRRLTSRLSHVANGSFTHSFKRFGRLSWQGHGKVAHDGCSGVSRNLLRGGTGTRWSRRVFSWVARLKIALGQRLQSPPTPHARSAAKPGPLGAPRALQRPHHASADPPPHP